jgi:hypothetical protein
MIPETFPISVKADGVVFCRKKSDDLVCDYAGDPRSRYWNFGDIDSIRVLPDVMGKRGVLMKKDGGMAFTILAGSTCLKDARGNVTCK